MYLNSSSVIRKWMIGIFISSVMITCNSPESQNQVQSNTESLTSCGFAIQPIFELEWVSNEPVLTKGDPFTAQNKYGFEGGRVIKYDDAYHMFTTEMYGNPLWTETRLAYWKSKDGLSWDRVNTIFESSGDFTGEDPRACLWSPMPIFDTKNDHWIITYVAYNSKPNSEEGWYRNFNGKNWMAISEKRGVGGLSGPYKDASIILQSGEDSDPWEGLMGTDSFYPFPVCEGWNAFYGSSPVSVGLAEAPKPEGPWRRKSDVNPVRRCIEIPIVTRLTDGRYVALFDGVDQNKQIGYMISYNGMQWSEALFFDLEEKVDPWWGLTRTPLGLVPESENQFTVFFTAYNKDMYGIPNIWQINDDSVFDGYYASVGMFRVKLKR